MPDLDQELRDRLSSLHWVLDSQEEALRLRLERAGALVRSLQVTIETEPRGTSTPTFHTFSIRGEMQFSKKLQDAPRDELQALVGESLGIPPKRRWGFGRVPDKPGLWQFTYSSFDTWTDWHQDHS